MAVGKGEGFVHKDTEFDGMLLSLGLFLGEDGGTVLTEGHGADLGGGLDM
jgi:hypothetical protein